LSFSARGSPTVILAAIVNPFAADAVSDRVYRAAFDRDRILCIME
jgi:hypothetical protein